MLPESATAGRVRCSARLGASPPTPQNDPQQYEREAVRDDQRQSSKPELLVDVGPDFLAVAVDGFFLKPRLLIEEVQVPQEDVGHGGKHHPRCDDRKDEGESIQRP